MASSANVDNHDPGAGGVRVSTIAWVSHTDGSVNNSLGKFVGEIVRVTFDPDSGGTQPSDQYDATITDSAGVDILGGQGANLSNVTSTQVCPGVPLKDGTTTSVVPCCVNDTLTLVIAAAGSGKGG